MDGADLEDLESADRSDAPPDERPIVAELHHIAGLTAGRTIRLRPGTFRMGLSPSATDGQIEATPRSLSFDLVIGVDGTVQLVAGPEPVAVEGIMVDHTAHLDDGDVIQLRSDHFQLRTVREHAIRRPDEPLTPYAVAEPPDRPTSSFWWWTCALLVLLGVLLGLQRPGFFGLALIGLGIAMALVALRRRRLDRDRSERARVLSNARSLFFNEILDSRKFAASKARDGAFTPSAVTRRAAAIAPSMSDQLTVTLASGDRSWDPPVVSHRDVGWDYEKVVTELSFLPAVPITVDLADAPIAITGHRTGALAVARHVITAALAMSPSDRGVAVDTLVPADWRWLATRSQPILRVLDGVAGPWSPRTIVIASSHDGLERLGDTRLFGAILEISADGSTTITGPYGTFGTDLVPHGITADHAREVHDSLRSPGPTIDLRGAEPVVDLSAGRKRSWVDETTGASTWLDPAQAPSTNGEAVNDDDQAVTLLGVDRVVVSGPDTDRNKDVLASAALLQAERHPDRAIFILDRGDRALIRLAQLAHCRRYAAIDQVAAVESMVAELTAFDGSGSGGGVLLLAPDLWHAKAFYRSTKHHELADQLDALIRRVQVVPMAASSRSEIGERATAAFLVWVDSAPTPMIATVHPAVGPVEQRRIDPAQLPGLDLTGSVARLVSSDEEEATS